MLEMDVNPSVDGLKGIFNLKVIRRWKEVYESKLIEVRQRNFIEINSD